MERSRPGTNKMRVGRKGTASKRSKYETPGRRPKERRPEISPVVQRVVSLASETAWAVETADVRVALLELAARFGSSAAAAELGGLYAHGLKAADGRVLVRRNSRRAMKWLRIGVTAGHTESMLDLAHLRSQAPGGESNDEVIALLRAGMRNGSWVAAHNLGCEFARRGQLNAAAAALRAAVRLGNRGSLLTLAKFGLAAKNLQILTKRERAVVSVLIASPLDSEPDFVQEADVAIGREYLRRSRLSSSVARRKV